MIDRPLRSVMRLEMGSQAGLRDRFESIEEAVDYRHDRENHEDDDAQPGGPFRLKKDAAIDSREMLHRLTGLPAGPLVVMVSAGLFVASLPFVR